LHKPKTTTYWLVLIVTVGGGLRLWLAVTAQGLNSDGPLYALVARRMAEAGVLEGMKGDYLWPYYPVNCRLVTYPFLGSLVYRVVGDEVLALRLVSVMSGTAVIVVTFALARLAFDNWGAALAGAGLVAIEPEAVRASAAVYRESLATFLALLALLLLLHLLKKPRRRWLHLSMLLGAALFAGFLTRVEFAIIAAVLCVIAGLHPRLELKRRVGIPLVVFVTFCALEAPYYVWLRRTTGHNIVNQWQIILQPEVKHTNPAERFLQNVKNR